MYIKQLYTNCLAQAAYYIESEGEAAIVDPMRNPEPYITLAHERNAFIKYVLETHFHADFVSGHLDLANETGATVVFGPDAKPEYKAHIATDGERLKLGNIQVEILHTPGHTIESTCFLVYNEAGLPEAIFTGDTLFAGDVGRPDLLSGNLDKEVLAAMLFESLQSKIKPLADSVIVYPGHGPGSACGKNIGPESQSTIGHEKERNYALRFTDKDEFIRAVTTDLPTVPGYFFKDARLNRTGYDSYHQVYENNLKPLSIADFQTQMAHGAVAIDTRDPMVFSSGFIPNAINIGLNGDFAVWAGTLIDPATCIILITEPGREKEAVERLARIGYDNVAGYLHGGMHTWFAADAGYNRIVTIPGNEIAELVSSGEYDILDVRNRLEVAKDRIPGAKHIPLGLLKDRYTTLGRDNKWLVYCAGGYRSMIAASYLMAHGFHFVASLEGGVNAIRKNQPEILELGMETE